MSVCCLGVEKQEGGELSLPDLGTIGEPQDFCWKAKNINQPLEVDCFLRNLNMQELANKQ